MAAEESNDSLSSIESIGEQLTPKSKKRKAVSKQTVDQAIDNFYKLKGQYDIAYNNVKMRIIKKEDLDLQTKKEEIAKIKIKCANCKRDVGTIFTTSDRNLKAVCGDRNKPCGLDIDIKLGLSILFSNLENDINVDLNTSQRMIIETKLLLLFGLINEDQMEESFSSLKQQYKSLIAANNTVSENLADQEKISTKEMNEGDGLLVDGVGDADKISRQTLAATNQVRLERFISNFREIIKEYELDSSQDTKMAKMRDAIEMYINSIQPTADIIRKTLFRVNTVIKKKKQYHMIHIKKPISEEVFVLDYPEIISNKK